MFSNSIHHEHEAELTIRMISWDFPAQPSQEFTENGAINKLHQCSVL